METNKKRIKIGKEKLFQLVEESIHQALKETSYDLARRAYEKSLETSRDPKTFYGIPDKVKRAERMFGHLKDRAQQNANPNVNYP